MKRCVMTILAVGFVCSFQMQAQADNPLSTEVKQAYQSVRRNLLGAAEKMPEADYSFKPTPEIRSFAEVLGHVTASQMHTCSAVLGDQKAGGAEPKTAKADVISALKESFDECDKAYDSLTDASATQMMKMGRGQRSKLGALVGNTTHDNEQYGILTVYLRLKGLVPPSSERSGRMRR